ncbi:hypothetical protein ACFQZW_11090 [Lutibacter aestuarii]|uniref:Uncharacterized protein n=1 Tax=Lutibacter aestuarii TaxID=861111 RepID=A0ABW2Z842_9FLAO
MIKQFYKHIISKVLIIAVLLPFAVQFIHSFENHSHHVCNAQNIVHFDTHEIDCSVFHFKINSNAIDFSSTHKLVDKQINNSSIYCSEESFSSTNIQHKSSRAPPFLMIL